METGDNQRYTQESPLVTEAGIALVMAMLMSLAIMALAAGVLYFVNQSSRMTGAGKRYVSASEAADGAVQVVKETVNLTLRTDIEGLTDLTDASFSVDDATCLGTAIWDTGNPCLNAALTLPGTMGTDYAATLSLARLYSAPIPGTSIVFPPTGMSSTAVFYRITATVTGPNNTTADVSVLYRYTQ
jgi:Tfp pilus assembly protein PilX